jgi:hypothetical protein
VQRNFAVIIDRLQLDMTRMIILGGFRLFAASLPQN